MIDIHNHVIFDVDDGPSTIKESIRMVLEAERLGISTIVTTPHFRSDITNAKKAVGNLEELRQRVRDCGINLYLGYEVFISPNISEMVTHNEVLRLNASNYLLLELPFDVLPAYTNDIIYKLHLNNIIPIIAHPERNRFLVNNFQAFIGLVEKGCLLQLDAASIIGLYGTHAANFTKKLIKLNLAHLVSSDAHSARNYTEWYPAARKRVLDWSGEEYTQKLFYDNAKAILGNSQSADKPGLSQGKDE